MRLDVRACMHGQVFLGTLREAEVERINDRISQAVMETCLAMTIFREEFNMAFVAMFTVLTFVKVSAAIQNVLLRLKISNIRARHTIAAMHDSNATWSPCSPLGWSACPCRS